MENLITTQKSLSDLIGQFESGTLAIPEIQRDVVWDSDQVRTLVESINLGYPCGSLILWEPREKDKSLVRSMIRPERLDQQDGTLPRYFLLDGQQRLTAIASVLLKRDKLKDILFELEEDMPYIYVNLKKLPREMEATTDSGGYNYPWVLMNRLYDGSIERDDEFNRLSPDDRDAIWQYTQAFRDYQFPLQIIRDRDYATVAEIFTLVNSQGTQLTGAEIHLARIVPHWRGITSEFRDYRLQLLERNYDLDLTFLMRAVTIVECQVPQIKKLAERVAKDKPTRRHLNETWRKAKSAMEKLIRVLQRDLSLDKSKYVVSKNSLVALIYYLANERSRRPAVGSVLRFFVLSQLAQHYSAAAESALRRDFRILTDPSVTPRQGLSELVDVVAGEARQAYRGMKVPPGKVKGLPSRNVMLMLMYLLMRDRQATDWGSGSVRGLEEIEPKDMQLHHIFPFNFMTTDKAAQKFCKDSDYTPAEFRTEVNDIANLTFLGREKNAAIADIPPWQYLPNETTKEMRKAHFIPEDPELWKPSSVSEFLAARRELIAKAMTSLIKSL
jgi:hypothetical protein